MAHSKVINKITAVVRASWDGTVFDENETVSPPKERDENDQLRPFIVVQFPYNTARPASIGDPGNNWYRETGAARIEMNIERGQGAEQARLDLETIAAALRGKDLGDGVCTWAPTSAIKDDRNEQGTYYSIAIAVPYWCDILG